MTVALTVAVMFIAACPAGCVRPWRRCDRRCRRAGAAAVSRRGAAGSRAHALATRPASPGSRATSTRRSSRPRRLTSPCCSTGARSGARRASSSSPRCSAVPTSSRSRSCSSPCISMAICPMRRSGAMCFASPVIPPSWCSSPTAPRSRASPATWICRCMPRVLDDALGDVRPVKDVIALATRGDAPLAAADCRRLAYHAFDLEDEGIFEPAKLQAGVRKCRAAVSGRSRQGTRAAARPGGRRGRDLAESSASRMAARPTRRSPC